MPGRYTLQGPMWQDLEFVYGENWQANFTAVDGQGTTVDITGATIQFRIATVAATPVTVATRTVGDGITITGAVAGTYSLNMTFAQQSTNNPTAILEGTRYLYNTRVTTSGGVVYDQARGHLNVTSSLIS